jgi:hypothetical protein
MTNTSSEHKKQSLLRTLAVLGLVAIIFLIAWLSVQIIQVAPSAFSSLASMAEGISNYEEAVEEEIVEFAVIGPDETIIAGDTTILTWDAVPDQTYSISYECAEGTAVSIVTNDGVREIACGERYDLGAVDAAELAITIETENADVSYTILAFTNDENEPTDAASGVIAIINPTLVAEVAGESTTATSSEETVEEAPVEPTPEPVDPEPVSEVVFALPVSDPNGFVDLSTAFVGVGETDDGLTTTLEQDSSGVFFFSVRNIGTKTSDTWDFSVALPDGLTYRSDTQLPLKPNEQATLALTVDTDDDNNHNFVVEIDTDEDRNTNNNEFSQRVRFTD